MAKVTVTSAEIQRKFGRYRDVALREPVSITSHGRPSLVLLSAEEYSRLRRRDRQALYAWELSDEDLKAIRTAKASPEARQFNREVKR